MHEDLHVYGGLCMIFTCKSVQELPIEGIFWRQQIFLWQILE